MSTIIGQNTRIVGRILGATDIEVHGQLEGDLQATGEVVVEGAALVIANIEAVRIVVRGAVRGDLRASEAILLEDGAKVLGDLQAPHIGITEGALVRGYVDSANTTGAARTKTSGAARPAPRPTTVSKPAAQVSKPVTQVSKPAPVKHEEPTPPPAKVVPVLGGKPFGKPAPAVKKPKAAPAPTVPTVKKGTKTALKTKRA